MTNGICQHINLKLVRRSAAATYRIRRCSWRRKEVLVTESPVAGDRDS